MKISRNIRVSLISNCLGILVFLPALALADDDDDGYFELQAQGGIAFWSVDDSSRLNLTTLQHNDKLKVTDEPTTFVGAVGAGYVWPLEDEKRQSLVWFPDIKLALNFYGMTGEVEGDVLEFGEEILNNYEYEIDIHSYRLMADGILSIVQLKQWSWFVLAGIGASWNRLSYHDTPNADIPGHSGVTLDEHTDTGFVWEVGTGIDYAVAEDLSVSLSYLYTDFGDLQLSDDGHAGRSATPLRLEGPEFDFSTQAILLGVEWAFK